MHRTYPISLGLASIILPKYGPGIDINLTGDDIALAISAFLVSQGVHVDGPRTITVNGELCKIGRVYVDPSGFVVFNGIKLDGRGNVT